jgi:hypothetical protein
MPVKGFLTNIPKYNENYQQSCKTIIEKIDTLKLTLSQKEILKKLIENINSPYITPNTTIVSNPASIGSLLPTSPSATAVSSPPTTFLPPTPPTATAVSSPPTATAISTTSPRPIATATATPPTVSFSNMFLLSVLPISNETKNDYKILKSKLQETYQFMRNHCDNYEELKKKLNFYKDLLISQQTTVLKIIDTKRDLTSNELLKLQTKLTHLNVNKFTEEIGDLLKKGIHYLSSSSASDNGDNMDVTDPYSIELEIVNFKKSFEEIINNLKGSLTTFVGQLISEKSGKTIRTSRRITNDKLDLTSILLGASDLYASFSFPSFPSFGGKRKQTKNKNKIIKNKSKKNKITRNKKSKKSKKTRKHK